jgi:hypothetical protein
LYLDLDRAERILRAQVFANIADCLRNAARRIDVIVLRKRARWELGGNGEREIHD